ncbi:MAG: hypothetical protein JO225_09535 [Candidatus Eremiobacteraeota bacterium]|nr:hypothetical protein [Candidatus Eremiobacteraeota bacterium]
MNTTEANLPHVSLNLAQRVRMIVVGLLVLIALGRVVPDVARVVYPLRLFGYTTDGDARVNAVRPAAGTAAPLAGGIAWRGLRIPVLHALGGARKATPTPAPGDAILLGDRVRIDRIRPFDRKPGIAGRGYTYDNAERYLPIERNGREQILHLRGRTESMTVRFFDFLRIGLFVVAVGLGAILFLVKPGIATAAFFCFCLGGLEAPSTFLDNVIPNPWRAIPDWLGDTIIGAVRPALLLFALCLIDGDTDAPRERVFAWIAAALGLGLGTLNALAQWRLTYGALPAEALDHAFKTMSNTISWLTVVALIVAFVRAPLNDRHRIGWIAAAFLFAGAARLLSDNYYPGHITAWFNSVLVSATIVPIVTIWIAVVRHRFFNVDFVVSRAVVYVALTAAAIGTISIVEEISTYVYYTNTDTAYVVLIGISMAIGAFTGKIRELLDHLVDRFIFHDRHEQRVALEFIAGYILDAETVGDVYRALLQDAPHALQLTFGGILARQPDGRYVLAERYNWPDDCVIELGPDDALTHAITARRSALTFTGKDTRLIQDSFPNERLTFAAPLFYDRSVGGIVVYGHNVSGLDLDPDEREQLMRVIAHASIAINTIELDRYRGGTTTAPAPLPSPSS